MSEQTYIIQSTRNPITELTLFCMYFAALFLTKFLFSIVTSFSICFRHTKSHIFVVLLLFSLKKENTYGLIVNIHEYIERYPFIVVVGAAAIFDDCTEANQFNYELCSSFFFDHV